MRVPWLEKEAIARQAERLIADYRAVIGERVTPPIPVEDVIERFLGLDLTYQNLDEKLGMDDVLGATYVRAKRIAINRKLLEDKNEGRLVFTCAHEVGHWVLHRHLVEEAARAERVKEAIVCRAKNAREPAEWQADYFASCLLMPVREMKEAFSMVCPSGRLVLDNVKSALGGTGVCIDPCLENWHFIAEMVREGGGFTNVSKEAVAFRMEELGLLINRTDSHIGW
ncbi:MAG: ImmA/IrrE family metallo-endopeptidase [Deltaproteobacteria bacterium]|nr:ImmA/IrrE family metallo-endopeptidase [Deltaproteobacteria bacterium]